MKPSAGPIGENGNQVPTTMMTAVVTVSGQLARLCKKRNAVRADDVDDQASASAAIPRTSRSGTAAPVHWSQQSKT